MKERLQKIIAAAGLCSRRAAEEWIEEGRVTVNGEVAALGEKADLQADRIEVDGRTLVAPEKKVTVVLYKPIGYITSMKDPMGRPVVSDLLHELPYRLYPVGRLDYNTEGLLLLTNDGSLARRLAHPRFEVEKTYLVRVRGQLSAQMRRQLETGVRLEDGMTAPAQVRRARQSGSHTTFELTIHEGRNRQVRRMCEAVGLPVSRLKRIRLGCLTLSGLKPGQWRLLSGEEEKELRE